MKNPIPRRALPIFMLLVLLLSAFSASVLASPQISQSTKTNTQKVIFIAADGLRQDLAVEYAALGLMPAVAKLMKTGAVASDNGLLTQAPPNTGAGFKTVFGSVANPDGEDFIGTTLPVSPG